MSRKVSKVQNEQGEYVCSFCGKPQGEVRRLIAGPTAVYICNECVDLCREIIDEEAPRAGEPVTMVTLQRRSLRARAFIEQLSMFDHNVSYAVENVSRVPHETLYRLAWAMLPILAELTRYYGDVCALAEKLLTPAIEEQQVEQVDEPAAS